MIKNENDNVNLLVSKKKISITFHNKGNYAIHDFTLNTEDLASYHYNIKDRDEYVIIVNASELLSTTKGISRKDGLKLSWLHTSEKLGVQIIKSGKDQTAELYVSIIRDKDYNPICIFDDYTEDEPVIKIPCKEFSDMCNQASVVKCAYMEIKGCSYYAVLTGLLHDGSIGLASKQFFSNKSNTEEQNVLEKITNNRYEYNIVKPETFITIKIPINTIKTLSKLHNIAPLGSLLKLYIIPEKPVKLECKIGSYGIYNLYIRDSK
jgi:hypothetical protein